MPSTATITAFYTFTQNTKARASQVTNNFSAFRGHIIPIEPLTVTSADITYDLGSDEHRWRTGYVKTLDFDRSTSTASATIEADANTNTGEIVFKLDGVEKARINASGISKSTNEIFSSVFTNSWSTSTMSEIATLSLSITGSGRPVRVGLTYEGGQTAFINNISYVALTANTNTASGICGFEICRNTVTSVILSTQIKIGNITIGANLPTIRLTPSSLEATDWSATSGTNRYFFRAISTDPIGESLSGQTLSFEHVKLFAFEL